MTKFQHRLHFQGCGNPPLPQQHALPYFLVRTVTPGGALGSTVEGGCRTPPPPLPLPHQCYPKRNGGVVIWGDPTAEDGNDGACCLFLASQQPGGADTLMSPWPSSVSDGASPLCHPPPFSSSLSLPFREKNGRYTGLNYE